MPSLGSKAEGGCCDIDSKLTVWSVILAHTGNHPCICEVTRTMMNTGFRRYENVLCICLTVEA